MRFDECRDKVDKKIFWPTGTLRLLTADDVNTRKELHSAPIEAVAHDSLSLMRVRRADF